LQKVLQIGKNTFRTDQWRSQDFPMGGSLAGISPTPALDDFCNFSTKI